VSLNTVICEVMEAPQLARYNACKFESIRNSQMSAVGPLLSE
jgi:hypothetical protein